MNKERNIGTPCTHRNHHSSSVPIPDRNSTKPPPQMSARFVEEDMRYESIEIDVHAKYNQSRRGRESKIGKYLPTGPQSWLFLEERWLTDSKIIHSFPGYFQLVHV